ncbi:MAG: hypothetical protein M1827_004784 [Pycnora praestabilis]|nr:MAG: hypothetical protein M1827_004784 [Pycnora praestabilis]
MGAMSPRRSSRARTTQPPSTGPSQQTNSSSSSSMSSSRADRSTRSHQKIESPQKPTPSRSNSSVEAEDPASNTHSEPPQTRRRKRELNEDDEVPKSVVNEDEEDEVEEEEVTRCICGHQDYPGLPVPLPDPANQHDSTTTPKEPNPTQSIDALPDDAGGLFIQCDICKVWQHGGCVGIMDEAMSPEEYFCEQCRHDLHRIVTGANGQKSSRYLPVYETSTPKPSRSSSHSVDTDSKSSKGKRSSNAHAQSLSTKRRSTMNSRDAAYDEEEQFRRAIEASKGPRKSDEGTENGSGKGKRGRSDSEESKPSHKRQRTATESPSSPSHPTTHSTSHNVGSDDETPLTKNGGNGGGRKVRGAAARNHIQKELRERENDKERERADAASRRKGRAERRKADESDRSDEYSASGTNSIKGATDLITNPTEPATSSQPPRDTPPPNKTPMTTNTSHHKKTGRPPTKRSRVGRNQYTKDRDTNLTDHNTAADKEPSPHRSGSLDDHNSNIVGGDEATNGSAAATTTHHVNGESGKPSRPRYMNPHRTSMNEMKRRVAAILEFISKTQLDLAGEQTPPGGNATTAMLKGLAEGIGPIITLNGSSGSSGSSSGSEGGGGWGGDINQKDFSELSSLEMMDVLTRRLVLWQKEFGKYGEK